MKIFFAYYASADTTWPITNFIQLNDEINQHLNKMDISYELYDTMYVGIIYMSIAFFETMKPRRIKFNQNENYFSIDIKIPLECIEWNDIKKFIIEEIISGLETATKKKKLKNEDVINVLKSLL
jgi:hypothetical protein